MLVAVPGDAEVPTLVTYDYTEIGSLEGCNDGNADVKFYGWLLVAILGLVVGIKLLTDGLTELGFWDGTLFGTTLGSIPTWCI